MSYLADRDGAKEFVREHVDLWQLIDEDVDGLEWNEEANGVKVTTSPFRDEANPSFKVSGKLFKDWGGEKHSGDAFQWVRITKGYNLNEAIIYLAQRYNIDITPWLRDPTPEEKQLYRYKQANRIAAEWMHECFRQNSAVRDDYLNRSGFTLDMVEPYQVGYCPNTDALVTHVANEMQISEDEVNKLEFTRRDLFTNALVYPVHNHSGEVCKFYTKQLSDPDAPYKSVRSDHPLNNKSILFGFHVARREFRSNGSRLVVVEGFRDAIATHGAGVMGSTITKDQLEGLSDYKISTILFCLDGDYSGWTNTLSLINRPDEFKNYLILVARPDLDKDPHDLWRDEGEEGLYRLYQSACTPLEYYVSSQFHGKELTLTNRQQLLKDIHEYLTKVSGIHLDMSAEYLAGVLGSTKQSVVDYIAEIKTQYSTLFNLEAERVVIAFSMKNSSSLSAFRAAGISAEAFTLSKYRKLFDSCINCFEKFGGDYTPQAVLDDVMAHYADNEIPPLVQTVLEENYRYTEPVACEYVLDMWRRRTISSQAKRLTNDAQDLSKPFVEAVNEHRRGLIEVTTGSKPQARTPVQLAGEAHEILKERNLAGANIIIGHSLDVLPSCNYILGGIQETLVHVVAGNTGAGKSILGMNSLKCIAVDQGVPTMWIGQEMVSFDNTFRLGSIMTGIPNSRLKRGKLTDKESKLWMDAKYKIENSGYHMFKPRDGTIDELVSAIDEYRFKYGIKVVIWDYIQLIQRAQWQRGISREEIIGHASKMMKHRVAEDMGLAVLIIAQQNRDPNQRGTAAVGGSYQLAQDCDVYMEIIKKNQKQIEQDGSGNGNRYIHIHKHRGGADNFVVNVKLDENPGTSDLKLEEKTDPAAWGKLHQTLVA